MKEKRVRFDVFSEVLLIPRSEVSLWYTNKDYIQFRKEWQWYKLEEFSKNFNLRKNRVF